MIIIVLSISLIICLLLSIYFSGSEAAYLGVNRHQFIADIAKGDKKAEEMRPLLDNSSRALTILLFGNNLANIASIYLAMEIWFQMSSPGTEAYFVPIVTLLFLIFCEILPKSIFRKYSNFVIYNTGKTLYFFEKLFYPLILFVKALGEMILFLPMKSWVANGKPINKNANVFSRKEDVSKAQKVNKTRGKKGTSSANKAIEIETKGESESDEKMLVSSFSREDFKDLIVSDSLKGALSEKHIGFMQRLANFSETKVRNLMTPLVDLPMVNIDISKNILMKTHQKSEMDFLPVYENRIDNIVGYIDVRNLFLRWQDKGGIKEIMKKPIYVPDNTTIEKIFHYLQDNQHQVMITVNEYGACSGLLSNEEVLQGVFGFRFEKNKRDKNWIKKLSKKSYVVDTAISIEDLNRILKLTIRKDGFETLGGFINHMFGYLPEEGAIHYFGKIRYTILKSTKQSVEQVKIDLL